MVVAALNSLETFSFCVLAPCKGVIAEGRVVSIDGVYDGREEHVCVWSQANSSHAFAVPRAAGRGVIRTATTFVHSNLLHCAAPEWNVPAECSMEDLGCHSHISLSILVNNVTYLPAAADTRPFVSRQGLLFSSYQSLCQFKTTLTSSCRPCWCPWRMPRAELARLKMLIFMSRLIDWDQMSSQ